MHREPERIAALYESYRFTCLHIALRITDDRALAEDALHNTFVQLLRQPELVLDLPPDSQKRRLMIVCKNKAIDLMRKNSRLICAELSEHELVAPDDPSQTAEEREDMSRLIGCIAKLPLIYRDAFELRYTEELSLKEIAALLGISKQAVAVRLHRGRAMLDQILQEEGARHEG